MKQLNYKPIGSVLLRLCGVVKRLFRKKLTYKERIDWFVVNFYETGMEYKIISAKLQAMVACQTF